MKHTLVLITLLILIKIANCQEYEFNSYGLKNSYTSNRVINVSADLIIVKENSTYNIKAYEPQDGSISMSCTVDYLKTDYNTGKYIYKGKVKFGQIQYGCLVLSFTKLSDFTKGIGNTDNFYFEDKYEIKVIYGNQNTSIENYTNQISVYPINLSLLNRKIPEGYVEPKYEEYIKDIDGNEYPIVKIGYQTWMAKNLAVTHFNNGDEILLGTEALDWEKVQTMYLNVNQDTSLYRTYGRLYTHYVVMDKRNVCPYGWHIPTEADWNKLFDYVGGISIAGEKLKTVGNEFWFPVNNGTNESKFSAVGAGLGFLSGKYFHFGSSGFYWLPETTYDSEGECIVISGKNKYVYMSQQGRLDGLSIRCVRNLF